MRLLLPRLHYLFALIASVLLTQNAFSNPEPSDATTITERVTVRGSEVRDYDWAKLQARARIAYVSSGPRTLGGRMIDDDLQTVFRFSESDTAPTVIVELSKTAELHRVTTVFKAEDAKLDVYLLNELPKNPNDLEFAKPETSVVSLPDDHGTISVNFSVSSARYIALRWKRKKSDEPFTVAEISALSNAPTDLISDTDPHLAENAKDFAITEPPPVGVISH